jgi:hypothetical protein
MNAVEIEEAVSNLAETPFDASEFPFAFLEAFGNKATTIKRLKSAESNLSDLGGVLQRNNIHIKVCELGAVGTTLTALRKSLATTKHKAKFILATDGLGFESENMGDGETIACPYSAFADHFGFFLPDFLRPLDMPCSPEKGAGSPKACAESRLTRIVTIIRVLPY